MNQFAKSNWIALCLCVFVSFSLCIALFKFYWVVSEFIQWRDHHYARTIGHSDWGRCINLTSLFIRKWSVLMKTSFSYANKINCSSSLAKYLISFFSFTALSPSISLSLFLSQQPHQTYRSNSLSSSRLSIPYKLNE